MSVVVKPLWSCLNLWLDMTEKLKALDNNLDIYNVVHVCQIFVLKKMSTFTVPQRNTVHLLKTGSVSNCFDHRIVV